MVDLSGTRDGVLTFDYIYGYAGMKNKTYEATVEVSTDGGQTWTPIWNFQETYHGETTQTVAGSAEIKVPAEYNVDGVQFAFRYVHPNEDTYRPAGHRQCEADGGGGRPRSPEVHHHRHRR